MRITGSIKDHELTFASTEWLVAHHEAKLPNRREFIRHLRIQPGSRILDVACGIGGWSSVLAEEVEGSSVIGFDRAPTLISAAEVYCESRVRSGRLHFRQADVSALPFGDDVFDVVFVANCLSYFEDAEQAIRDLYRTLKPSGRLIVRNFDDGLVSLHPCDPQLNLKVLWAAALESGHDPADGGIDPFEGRKLKEVLSRCVDEPIRSFADATVFSWPFSSSQSIYIAKNVEWYGRRASKALSQNEIETWMSFVEYGHPNSIFENRISTYCTVDFCAEIVKRQSSVLPSP